jgi:hypothetical protein
VSREYRQYRQYRLTFSPLIFSTVGEVVSTVGGRERETTNKREIVK